MAEKANMYEMLQQIYLWRLNTYLVVRTIS
jgi:hypothetical protein